MREERNGRPWRDYAPGRMPPVTVCNKIKTLAAMQNAVSELQPTPMAIAV